MSSRVDTPTTPTDPTPTRRRVTVALPRRPVEFLVGTAPFLCPPCPSVRSPCPMVPPTGPIRLLTLPGNSAKRFRPSALATIPSAHPAPASVNAASSSRVVVRSVRTPCPLRPHGRPLGPPALHVAPHTLRVGPHTMRVRLHRLQHPALGVPLAPCPPTRDMTLAHFSPFMKSPWHSRCTQVTSTQEGVGLWTSE